MGTPQRALNDVEAIHRFNRFYFSVMQPVEATLAADFEFLPMELQVFREISPVHGTTAPYIARQLKMHPSQLSRVLSALRAQGLIEEAPEAYNRRIKRVTLSSKGAEVRQSMERIRDRAVEAILGHLTSQQRGMLVTALETAAWLLGSRQVPRPTAPAT